MRSKPSLVAIGLSLVMLFFSRASMAQQTQQSTEQAKTVSAPPTDQPAAPSSYSKTAPTCNSSLRRI
jgi:hypothetical protein